MTSSNNLGRKEALFNSDSPEQLAYLAKTFTLGLDMNHPDLEKVREAYQSQNWQGTLDAYKIYFFDKLHKPEKYGRLMRSQPRQDVAYIDVWDWAYWFTNQKLKPDEITARDAIARAQMALPVPLNWKNAVQNPKGGLGEQHGTRVGVLGASILSLYIDTGDEVALKSWVRLMDDWSMHVVADLDSTTENLRLYYVHVVKDYLTFLGSLREASLRQPKFIDLLPSTTLARLLMTCNDEYPAASIRLMRSVVQNHRAEGVAFTFQLGILLSEFKVGQFCIREAKRLLELNGIHRCHRDGANMEYADWGHEHLDQMAIGVLLPKIFEYSAEWNTPQWRQQMWDIHLLNAKYFFRLLPPSGASQQNGGHLFNDYLPSEGYKNVFWNRSVGATHRVAREIFAEPKWAALPYKVFGMTEFGVPAKDSDWKPHLGEYNSDFMAYSGHYYLRSGWESDDLYLEMTSKSHPSSNFGNNNSELRIDGFGLPLATLNPVSVNGYQQNEYVKTIINPGHYYKTNALVCAPEWPIPVRWHSSANYDLAEAIYHGPYEGIRKIIAPSTTLGVNAIYGVKATRHVMLLRPHKALLVVDRMESEQERLYRQEWVLPYREFKAFAGLDTSASANVIQHELNIAPANGPALSLHQFCSAPLANTVHMEDQDVKSKDDWYCSQKNVKWQAQWKGTGMQVLGTLLVPQRGQRLFRKFQVVGEKGFEFEGVIKEIRGDSVYFDIMKGQRTGAGLRFKIGDFSSQDQTYIRAWTPNTQPVAQGVQPVKVLAKKIPSSSGVTGFKADLPHGACLTYLAATEPRARLQVGKIDSSAEALLLTQDSESQFSGLVLGCEEFVFAGNRIETPTDFEFSMVNDTITGIQGIYRPISPVEITPARNVFIDEIKVELKSLTPDVEIRYTTNLQDPTLKSTLYNTPLILRETTMVKARAFRRGVTHMPMDISGTQMAVVSQAVFTKEKMRTPRPQEKMEPGLKFEYLEGSWLKLFSQSNDLPATKSGCVTQLFDISSKATEEAFVFRYSGDLDVPRDGVYTFYAPSELIYPVVVSGYDLRVFVGNEEWYPATRHHAQGTWSIALAKGAHRFKVIFTECRIKSGRNVWWRNFGLPHTIWKGTTPTLEISGPNFDRQSLPNEWFKTVNDSFIKK